MSTGSPTSHPVTVEGIKLAERQRQAYTMRERGYDYESIARAMDLTPTQVRRIVRNELERTQADHLGNVEQSRALMLRRLETIFRNLYSDAFPDAVDGKRKPPNIKAVKQLLSTVEKQCRLLGLMMPDGFGVDSRYEEIAGIIIPIMTKYMRLADAPATLVIEMAREIQLVIDPEQPKAIEGEVVIDVGPSRNNGDET